MKLYWSPRSPFVRKVMVLAHETGLADKIQKIPTPVAMTQPHRELMRHNPVGKIPTLITDAGDALYDSTVICEYLDGLHGGERRFPAAGARRWQVLRRHSLGNNLLDILVLWRNERLRPAAQQSPEWAETFTVKTQATLDALEADTDAVNGPFLIDQITLGCTLGYLDFRFAELAWRARHPSLAAWYTQFMQRASARHTMPVDE